MEGGAAVEVFERKQAADGNRFSEVALVRSGSSKDGAVRTQRDEGWTGQWGGVSTIERKFRSQLHAIAGVGAGVAGVGAGFAATTAGADGVVVW